MARMRVLESIPGNPVGIAFRQAGNTVALMAKHLPSPPFNSVVGLRRGQADHIRPLVDWYDANGVAGRFEIAAGEDDAAFGREFAKLGYFQSDCHAALVGDPESDTGEQDATEIELVSSPEQMERFLTAYVAGWGIPGAVQEQFKRNVRPWLREPGWSLYLATIDGRPVAAATLSLHKSVGYLADSATDPAYRGRSVHAALLRRRMRDAAAAGVELVCSGADFLSTSHRNMERVGMRLLFLRSIWTRSG
jgi:ribosomal protein S18 acetylase RimI-like enzyme